MSKEEALIYQKALITTKEKEIKKLRKSLDEAEGRISFLKAQLRDQTKADMRPELIKRYAERAKRHREKKELKDYYRRQAGLHP